MFIPTYIARFHIHHCALLYWGWELEDRSLVDEAGDCLFEGSSGGERPDKGSLSLDRDLRGGIGEGLGGHVCNGDAKRVGCRAIRSRRRRQGSCVVYEAGPYASWRVTRGLSPWMSWISSRWPASWILVNNSRGGSDSCISISCLGWYPREIQKCLSAA